jgi:hypothetical protein
VPDLRETEYYAGEQWKMIFDGTTIMNQTSGEAQVFIIESWVTKLHERFWGERATVRKRALLNEVYSVYFSHLIHNKYLMYPLSYFWLPMPGTIHELSEALGDLWSLKYGDNFQAEVERIMVSDMQWYGVSREIMRKWMWFVIQKERIKVQWLWITKDWIRDLSQRNPRAYNAFKDGVIQYYEDILIPIMKHIISSLPK